MIGVVYCSQKVGKKGDGQVSFNNYMQIYTTEMVQNGTHHDEDIVLSGNKNDLSDVL